MTKAKDVTGSYRRIDAGRDRGAYNTWENLYNPREMIERMGNDAGPKMTGRKLRLFAAAAWSLKPSGYGTWVDSRVIRLAEKMAEIVPGGSPRPFMRELQERAKRLSGGGEGFMPLRPNALESAVNMCGVGTRWGTTGPLFHPDWYWQVKVLRDLFDNPWDFPAGFYCEAKTGRFYRIPSPRKTNGAWVKRKFERIEVSANLLGLAKMVYGERGERKCDECGGRGQTLQGGSVDGATYEACNKCHGGCRLSDNCLDWDKLQVLADAIEEELGTEEPCPLCWGEGMVLSYDFDEEEPTLPNGCPYCSEKDPGVMLGGDGPLDKGLGRIPNRIVRHLRQPERRLCDNPFCKEGRFWQPGYAGPSPAGATAASQVHGEWKRCYRCDGKGEIVTKHWLGCWAVDFFLGKE